MTVPAKVRAAIRDEVWALADEVDWATLSDSARSHKYEDWTRDPGIGGVLGHYIDAKHVRVYLKDSVIKPYTIARGSDQLRPFRVLELADEPIADVYTKPHGRRLEDGRVVCWGQARDWKAVVIAVWERAYQSVGCVPYAAVLTFSTGQWSEPSFRRKVDDLAERLSVSKVLWLDV